MKKNPTRPIGMGNKSICSRALVTAAVTRATHAVAPCWPLKDFVAVNPFLGPAYGTRRWCTTLHAPPFL